VTTSVEHVALKPLAPLARTIAETVRDTPVRLGTPEGASDLVAALIVKVAAYVGRELGPDARVLGEVQAERDRQDAKFGEQNHPDGTGGPVMREQADAARAACQYLADNGGPDWRAILLEEVYEALAEEDPALLRAELVQVAAVAIAWVAAIDRRTDLQS
jgi:hypothetical protein